MLLVGTKDYAMLLLTDCLCGADWRRASVSGFYSGGQESQGGGRPGNLADRPRAIINNGESGGLTSSGPG